MIFDLAFQRVWHLFKPWNSFPIVYLSRVEWQVLVPAFYEFDSVVRGQHIYKSAWTLLTERTCKCILGEDNKHNKYAINDRLLQHLKGG